MATTLTIDGVNKASIINWESVRREEVLTKEPNKLTFRIKKHNGQSFKPTSGDEVVLTVGSTKEFGGFITEINETIEGRVEYIVCNCKDYTHSLDRQLVAKTYTSQTVNQIIDDLLSSFATGFTDSNVDCPVTIDKVQFNYLTISQCLEKLTTLVENYEWYVDYDKDIHFFASNAEAATFDLTDTSANYVFNSLSIREDTHQLRNEVIIRGGLLTSDTNRIEIITGDNNKKIFPLATKFASRPAVSINNSSVTVGIENLESESGYQVMWNYGEKSLRFASSLATGTTTVTAPYQYPLILQKRDEASIALYGIFQGIIVDRTIVDLNTASLRADVEFLKFAQPMKSAKFETYTNGLMTGQTINIQSDIRGIDEDFKIQAIRSSLRTPNTDELVHTIEAITSEDIGINDILAKLLIQNPSEQVDLSQDEVLVRIRGVSESIAIADSVGTPSTTSGPYVWDTATWGFSTWG